MSNAADPTVETSSGRVQGRRQGGVAAFHALPYAAPSVGELRFAAPRPHPGWTGVRDATQPGPALTQPASRLEAVMGKVSWPQSEAALTLTVWTPEVEGRLPVLVWIHGGGYSSGSASWPWYEGRRLAATGPLVVVGINYRLGALGFLYVAELDGVDTGAANRGLLDQVAALEWVRENIARFGGDPEQVTLAGQSGGGGSIAAMMAMPPAKRLFRRAILQSPALLPPFPKEEAIEISRRYRTVLGTEGADLRGLRSATVDRLLAAQLEVAASERRLADLRPPFQFVTDGTVMKRDFNDELRTGAGAGVDVVIGSNRGELRLPVPEDTTYEQVIGRIRPAAGAAGEALIAEYAAALGDGSPAHLLGPLLTDEYIFRSLRLAGDQVRSGDRAYVYTFDWAPAGSRFGCCHTLELPFVFDNFAAWAASPMLEGAEPAEMAAVGRPLHTAWASFAARGEPQPAGGPRWEPYDPFTRKAMHFGGSQPAMEDAPGGPTLSLWERLY